MRQDSGAYKKLRLARPPAATDIASYPTQTIKQPRLRCETKISASLPSRPWCSSMTNRTELMTFGAGSMRTPQEASYPPAISLGTTGHNQPTAKRSQPHCHHPQTELSSSHERISLIPRSPIPFPPYQNLRRLSYCHSALQSWGCFLAVGACAMVPPMSNMAVNRTPQCCALGFPTLALRCRLLLR